MSLTLRAVDDLDPDRRRAVLALRVADHQVDWVAPVEKSLREAADDPALTALAAYGADQLGLEQPDRPPVGMAVVEVRAGVGFVLRILVDADQQGRGHGRALLAALVRRLEREPAVEVVATSHRRDNAPMAALCAAAGFEPWATPFDPPEGEVYLRLPD